MVQYKCSYKNIFSDDELDKNSVIEEFSVTKGRLKLNNFYIKRRKWFYEWNKN